MNKTYASYFLLSNALHKLRFWEPAAHWTSELLKLNTHLSLLHIYSQERVLWVPLRGSCRGSIFSLSIRADSLELCHLPPQLHLPTQHLSKEHLDLFRSRLFWNIYIPNIIPIYIFVLYTFYIFYWLDNLNSHIHYLLCHTKVLKQLYIYTYIYI